MHFLTVTEDSVSFPVHMSSSAVIQACGKSLLLNPAVLALRELRSVEETEQVGRRGSVMILPAHFLNPNASKSRRDGG